MKAYPGLRPGDFALALVSLLFCAAVCLGLGKQNAAMVQLPLLLIGLVFLSYLFIWHIRWFVFSFVFLIPLSVPFGFGGHVIGMPSEVLLLVMGFLLTARMFLNGWPNPAVLRHPVIVILFIYLAWMCITAMTGVMPVVSFKRVLMTFFFILVFLLYLREYFRDRRNIRLFFFAYALGSIYPVTHALVHHGASDFSMGASYDITRPFYPDHTMYAACLVFVCMAATAFAFRRNEGSRLFRLSCLALAIYTGTGIYFSFSRAAWLSVMAALTVFLIFRLRLSKWFILGLTIVFAGLGYWQRGRVYEAFERNTAVSTKGDLTEHVQSLANISSDASNAERLNRWYSAFRMFRERPLTGFGPGTYQFVYGTYQVPDEMTRISTMYGDKGNAHSEYLNVLTESGLPGLLLMVLLLAVTFRRGYLLTRSENGDVKFYALLALISLAAYFVHGLFNAFMDADKAAVLVYGAMAMIVALEEKKKVPVDP